ATGWAFGRRLAAAAQPSDGPAGERLRLHRDLARRLRDDYREDARALDAEFFSDMGGPMSAALEAAPGRAAARAQSVRAEDVFAPQELRRIRAWADFTAGLLLERPGDWSARFRAGYRAALEARRPPRPRGLSASRGTSPARAHP